MHRLIGVVIVGIPVHIGWSLLKEVLKVSNRQLFSAQLLRQSVNIVRYKPTLLIRGRLHTSIPLLYAGIFGPLHPFTISLARTEPALLIIEEIAPRLRLEHICFYIITLAQRLRQLRYTPVKIGIFKGMGDRCSRHGVTQLSITKLR